MARFSGARWLGSTETAEDGPTASKGQHRNRFVQPAPVEDLNVMVDKARRSAPESLCSAFDGQRVADVCRAGCGPFDGDSGVDIGRGGRRPFDSDRLADIGLGSGSRGNR